METLKKAFIKGFVGLVNVAMGIMLVIVLCLVALGLSILVSGLWQ